MRRSGYTSALDARTALRERGYGQAFSAPGAPGKWTDGRRDLAIGQSERGDWRIVPYPVKLERRARLRLRGIALVDFVDMEPEPA